MYAYVGGNPITRIDENGENYTEHNYQYSKDQDGQAVLTYTGDTHPPISEFSPHWGKGSFLGISLPFYLFREYEREVVVVHHEDFKENPYGILPISLERGEYIYDETLKLNSIEDAKGLTERSWENTSEDRRAMDEFQTQAMQQFGAAGQSQGGFGYVKPRVAAPTANPSNSSLQQQDSNSGYYQQQLRHQNKHPISLYRV